MDALGIGMVVGVVESRFWIDAEVKRGKLSAGEGATVDVEISD